MAKPRSRFRLTSLCALIAALSAAGARQGRAAVYPLDIVAGVGDVISAPPGRAPKVERYGRWVVYLADADIDGLEELWSAPLPGGDPLKISDSMLPGDQILEFQLSPNGNGAVAFLASYSGQPVQLYLTAVGYQGPIFRKSHDLDPGGFVSSFGFSHDGEWLVYTAQTDPGVVDLFRVPTIGPGSPQAFSFTSAAPDCDTVADRIAFSDPALTGATPTVAFRVTYVCNSVPGLQSLHRALLSDTSAATVEMGFAQARVDDFQFNPYSDPVLLTYLIDPDGLGPQSAIVGWDDLTPFAADHHVGSSGIAGGTVTSFLVDLDLVVFRADRDADEEYELFLVTAGVHGPPQVPLRLHEDLTGSRVEDVYKLSPTGERVAFVRTEPGVGQELRSSQVLSPGGSTLLETVLAPGKFERFEMTYSASTERTIFRADRDEVDRVELFSVPTSGAGAVTRLNPIAPNPLLVAWDVRDFESAPDGSHVVFVYETEAQIFPFGRQMQLFSSLPAGGGSIAVGPALDPATHDGFLALEAPGAAQFSSLLTHWTVSVHDAQTPGVRRITLSDHCLFCDSFLGELARWELNP